MLWALPPLDLPAAGMDLSPVPALVREFSGPERDIKKRGQEVLLGLQRFVRSIEQEVAKKSAVIRASVYRSLEMLTTAELDGWAVNAEPNLLELKALQTSLADDSFRILPVVKQTVKAWRKVDREQSRKAQEQYDRLKAAIVGAETDLEDFIDALNAVQRRMTPDVKKASPITRATAAYSEAVIAAGFQSQVAQMSSPREGPFLVIKIPVDDRTADNPEELARIEDVIHETVRAVDQSLMGRAVISFVGSG